MKNNLSNNLTIIVPTYNEEKYIDDFCKNIKALCNNFQWNLIIVDDGSDDDTPDIVKNHDIKIITHKSNRGYGAALKSGIKNASTDWILIIDADGTYPIDYIDKLVELSDSADMVVAARTGKNVKIPLIRKPAKWVIAILANYLAKQKIPDINSGLRLFKKNIALKFFNILPNGFSFTTTITLAMLCNGYNVVYSPIDYEKRIGKSKIRPIYDTLNFIQLIFRTVLYFAPLRVFIPVSFISFILSAIVFFGSWIFAEKILDATSMLFAFLGMQMLALGLIADLIDKRTRPNNETFTD